ncbi:MAG TPA: D-alanyl-D-alanine carboxypeptidase [Candidatus Tectomicrobia bacterium]|nr:D-alanyl-D-alanine carboxypeptidase [Candidatus Tectomicrobia bacterium]
MIPTGLVVAALLLVSWNICCPPPSASADPNPSAVAALVMDAETGKVLYEKNALSPLPMASTTKIMTALVAVERLRPHEVVQVSAHAAAMAPSKIYLRPGELMRADDLLQAILLKSANDASAAIAEKISGSEAAFARVMTRRARELGAQNTHFENASGLPADDHYSTAYDLAVILRYAMQRPDFAEIMQMRTASIESLTGRAWTVRNHNRLLWTFPGALGGKTGWTRASRHCYVGMVEHGGRTLIVSVLASSRLWSDVNELLVYGFASTGSGEPRFASLSGAMTLPSSASTPFPEPRPSAPKLPGPKPREPKPAEFRGGNTPAYTVQVGAFRDKRMAETLRRRLRQRGYSASVTASGTRSAKFYRVRLGEFDTHGEAKRLVGRLKSQMGLEAVVATGD